MGRRLSTYYTDDDTGHCEVHFDFKNEMAYIKYFDENGKQFYVEEFPNKSIHYVNDAAENWVNGIKSLPIREKVV
jgi:hypothetical protein